ncbi:hypothetical protein nbrc107696_34850 [Gordonia spumicola]|uniref:HTH merR-type domain-containing protein n=1 Tax=Gordonia spumicola TaxID=589161 RepID=A0A7I9VCD4_9ACTN|nr:MerR family transcriptional regulator [Gordonia spumicola]GEE03039.1 hypothetical protein nbrc107696_34850 [Gordonia spumicola]
MTEYRIDDLARASGTTTRNIRGYQERGLLPAPLRRGRVAIYTERHLANLRAINRLLSNGFTLKHIGTFLTNPRAMVAEALDLPDLLDLRWAQRRPDEITHDELERALGPVDAETLDALVDARILTRVDGSSRVRAVDDNILRNLGRLVARGMELRTLIVVHHEFTDRLADAVRVLMSGARDEIVRREGPGWIPSTPDEVEWVTDLLATMRSSATANAYAALDRALDDARDAEVKDYLATVEMP